MRLIESLTDKVIQEPELAAKYQVLIVSEFAVWEH